MLNLCLQGSKDERNEKERRSHSWNRFPSLRVSQLIETSRDYPFSAWSHLYKPHSARDDGAVHRLKEISLIIENVTWTQPIVNPNLSIGQVRGRSKTIGALEHVGSLADCLHHIRQDIRTALQGLGYEDDFLLDDKRVVYHGEESELVAEKLVALISDWEDLHERVRHQILHNPSIRPQFGNPLESSNVPPRPPSPSMSSASTLLGQPSVYNAPPNFSHQPEPQKLTRMVNNIYSSKNKRGNLDSLASMAGRLPIFLGQEAKIMHAQLEAQAREISRVEDLLEDEEDKNEMLKQKIRLLKRAGGHDGYRARFQEKVEEVELLRQRIAERENLIRSAETRVADKNRTILYLKNYLRTHGFRVED